MNYKRKITGTSLEEIRFFYFIKKIFPNTINRYAFKHKYTKNAELDIFVPHLNLAIEYDGVYYHSSDLMAQKDSNKNSACDESGIRLLRIREKGLTKISPNDIIYDYIKKGSHKSCCKELICFIKNNFSLSEIEINSIENLDYDNFEIGPEILELYEEIETASSLSIKNPKLSKEWNYEKNNGLEPSKIKPNSNLLVWWKCNICNHEWQATTHERHRGTWGCSRCRSLAAKRPGLAKEWHPTKNEKLTPFDVSVGSQQIVWWMCDKDGEYQMSIDERRRLKSCPCHATNTHNLNEYNNFAAVNPEISKQWHSIKNGSITPKDIFPTSTKKYWWICEKRHEYESTPHQRHHMRQNCPYCTGKKTSVENSLFIKRPELTSYWDFKKNKELTPHSITFASGKNVYWKCKNCGNEWENSPNNLKNTKVFCKCQK